ncbi:MAG: ATP-binding cassette domain-containing protein [Pirellulaceae bacterium]|nr:ATP-binding cassette domain-containing protein [Pirellulaceae bacterium]
MILLAAESLRKYFSIDPVLSNATFTIYQGERVGLVGPNGAGKSTLLNILTKKTDSDGGKVEYAAGVKVGFLEQHSSFAASQTVWQVAESALAELNELLKKSEHLAGKMSQTTDPAIQEELGQKFDQLQEELTRREGYQIAHKIERVLQGLGFKKEQFTQSAASLSGGQQNRLLLAKLLLEEVDFLILDEPTNHLDIEATRWLEDYLISSRQTIIVVSHDRYFLDKVTTKTLELSFGTVDTYSGNFSAYWHQKGERLEIQRKTYTRQQEEIERLEAFIRKNMAGQKTVQAQDRQKKLAKMERVAPPKDIRSPRFVLPKTKRSGDFVLRTKGVCKSFDENRLFQNVTFDVMRGEKWGILGPNGSGKTTLLKCLIDQLKPDRGEIRLGSNVRCGYIDQKLSLLEDDQEVVYAIQPPGPEMPLPQRRDLLARFGLTGDLVFQRVSSLSGGERNRAALAKMVLMEANFLMLDEPTNHLDLWGRDALEKALREFDGTLLLVSHDRYFLNQVVDHLLILDGDDVNIFDGSFADYEAKLLEENRTNESANEKRAKEKNEEKRPQKRGTKKRKYPYRKGKEIEKEIEIIEGKVEQNYKLMGDEEVMRNPQKAKELSEETKVFQEKLRQLYDHWEEANELNS